MANDLARSRNLYPSYFERPDVLPSVERVLPTVDIDEPLTIRVGETKTVGFRYRSGVPSATAFGLTWHETQEDADLRQNQLQDEPLPTYMISPPSPRRDTGGIQYGTVELVSPENMRGGILYGSMGIYGED